MPEFGGIASIALINTLKAQNLVNVKECDFGSLLGEYFADSCIPGSRDILHDPKGVVPQSLCNLCRTSIQPPQIPLSENADVLPDERTLDGDEVPEESPVADDAPVQDEGLTAEEMERRSLRGSCAATSTNRYYGNQGSLQCLDELGDLAVLEAQYLNGNYDASSPPTAAHLLIPIC